MVGCRGWSMVGGWGWGMVRLFWVMGHSLICDLSNVAIVVISSVLHMLSSTIWEGYRV